MRAFYLSLTITIIALFPFNQGNAGAELKSGTSGLDARQPQSMPVLGAAASTISPRTAQNAGVSGVDYSIFFTDEFNVVPLRGDQSSFDCVGTIYTAIKLRKDDYDLRNTRIWLQWINPQGKTELLSTKLGYEESNTHAYRWASMVLSRPPGGGLFSLLEPSAGMERFIGDWQVVIHVGDQELAPRKFTIYC